MKQENELIAQAQTGDLPAFEQLIGGYQQKVYNLALHFTGNETDANDLAQEALLKVFKHLKKFKGNSSFFTWIYRIVWNTYLDEFKKTYSKNRQNEVSLDAETETYMISPAHEQSDPLEEAHRQSIQRLVRQGIQKLPEDFRLTLVLCDLQGCSYQEVMETANVALGTVKSRLNRGRQMLKEILKELGMQF